MKYQQKTEQLQERLLAMKFFDKKDYVERLDDTYGDVGDDRGNNAKKEMVKPKGLIFFFFIPEMTDTGKPSWI